ncbi:MAG TPA: MerR family transcriptional regulator [Streptomyces sp.]|nr:MerR family transcriptional regulator [Streptomyces sp.]
MDDDGSEPLTIGRLSRRTGMPVRTIRYWSDVGTLPPSGRTAAGYRLYDAASVARLELIRTLRELGLGLEDVRRVLERETTVAAVAAVHVDALDAQIHTLRLRRAVLSTVVARQSGTEETTLMNKLARLSTAERRQIMGDFVEEVFGGIDTDPQLREKMAWPATQLPDEPTPAQVDAWLELGELVQDPGFRRRMRRMAEFNAQGRARGGAAGEPGAYLWFSQRVVELVGAARERGVTPQAAEADGVLAQLLRRQDSAERRAAVRERLEAGTDGGAERYRQLVTILQGEEPRPSHTAEFGWLAEALAAHPVPGA